MAQDLQLALRLVLRSEEFQSGLRKALRDLGGLEAGSSRLASAFGRLGHYAAAVVGAGGLGGIARAFVAASDQLTQLRSRLEVVAGSTGGAARAFGQLYAIAQESRQPVAELADTYSRMMRAARELGASQEAMLGVTRTISQAMAIGGGSAESMRAALVQLGQAMASGVLRGEELNSILEQAPRLAQAIADGMGVSVGRLRALGEQGKLTAAEVFEALQKQAPRIAEEFARMRPTVDGAFQQLRNAAGLFAAELDKGMGATSALGAGVQSLAQALERAAPAARRLGEALGPLAETLGWIAAVAGLLAGGKLVLGAGAAALGMLRAHPLLGGAAIAGGAAATALRRAGPSEDAVAAELARLDRAISRLAGATDDDSLIRLAQLEQRREALRARQRELALARLEGVDLTRDELLWQRAAELDPRRLRLPFPGAPGIEQARQGIETPLSIAETARQRAIAIAKAYQNEIAAALAAGEKDRASLLEREMRTALRMVEEERIKALHNLPDAQRARDIAAASAEVATEAAKSYAARWREHYEEELARFRLSAEEYVEALAGLERYALLEERRATAAQRPVTEAERIRQRGSLAELDRKLADVDRRAEARREKFAEERIDAWRELNRAALEAAREDYSAMETAGRQFAERYGRLMQQAAASGWEDVLEAGRRALSAMLREAESDDIRRRMERAQAIVSATEQSLQSRTIVGLETEASARRKLRAAIGEQGHALASELLPRIEALLATTTDPRRLAELQALVDKIREMVSIGRDKTWAEGLVQGAREYADAAADAFQTAKEAAMRAFGAMEDALVRWVTTGKLNVRDFANSVLADMARLVIREQITSPLAKAAGGWLADLFGGFRASGGPVEPGRFYVVGERGPELLFPRAPGVVLPAAPARPERHGPTVFIDARGADREGFARLERLILQLNGSIEQRAVNAVLDARRRGGSFASAFG